MSFNDIIQSATWYEKIRALRAIKNWSQEQAAENCGTCKRLYWNWENGKHYPSKRNQKAIASAFGVSQSELFNEEQTA
jgi:transcriptional regulator with XRE-family HTH domain